MINGGRRFHWTSSHFIFRKLFSGKPLPLNKQLHHDYSITDQQYKQLSIFDISHIFFKLCVINQWNIWKIIVAKSLYTYIKSKLHTSSLRFIYICDLLLHVNIMVVSSPILLRVAIGQTSNVGSGASEDISLCPSPTICSFRKFIQLIIKLPLWFTDTMF